VLVRSEPLRLLFTGQSTSARSEIPQGWPLGPMDKHTWRPWIYRPKVGSADPRVGRPQVGPTQGLLPWGGCPVGP
jgi:hypothetical protein